MNRLIPFLKPYKKECLLGPLFKLFEAILELILPTIMALIINKGVILRDMTYVFKMGSVMLLMSILGFCSSMVCQYFAARASQGFGTLLRNAMFKHISSFSYREIDDFGTASLINRITNDVNQLQVAVAMLIRLVFRAPFICIGSIIMAMILNLKLSLILFAAVPIFATILYFIIKKASPLYLVYQQKLDKITVIIKENLSGIRVIRAFAKDKSEQERFREANDDITSTAIRIGKISAVMNPMTTFIVNVAIIAILWTGGIQTNAGKLSQGEIIAFVNYITQILLALIVVSNLIILYTKAFASVNRINEVLSMNSSITESLSEIIPQSSVPMVEFKNVDFSYNQTGDLALENISVSIGSGETVGLIGSTGSGKSTFINLIPRFYDVKAGEILVQGINVKEYPLQKLREKVRIVPQEVLLFTGTIAENIRWGKPDADNQEIISATKIAQSHEFIEGLPEKHNTLLDRGGANLSGGQKQRLTIARALVSKPEILILDDSSSALDYATDAALRKAIKDELKTSTIFIVSQRASSIKHADKIIVFEDGKIVGIGTHEELIETNVVYREICFSQLSQQEV